MLSLLPHAGPVFLYLSAIEHAVARPKTLV